MKTKIIKYLASIVPFISTAISVAGDFLYISTDIRFLLQLKAFRRLKPYAQTKGEELVGGLLERFIVDNYRPVQPLNGRTVRRNFVDEDGDGEMFARW